MNFLHGKKLTKLPIHSSVFHQILIILLRNPASFFTSSLMFFSRLFPQCHRRNSEFPIFNSEKLYLLWKSVELDFNPTVILNHILEILIETSFFSALKWESWYLRCWVGMRNKILVCANMLSLKEFLANCVSDTSALCWFMAEPSSLTGTSPQ